MEKVNSLDFYPYPDLNIAVFPTVEKISRFKNLEKGWDCGRGSSFDQKIIDYALKLHKEIIDNGFLETEAFPGPDGSILISLYFDHNCDLYCLDFTVEPDMSLTYSLEVNDEQGDFTESFSFDDAKEIIQKYKKISQNYRKEAWTSLELSIKGITIHTDNASSGQLLSNLLEQTEEFLFSKENAHWGAEELFASTSENIMLPLPVSL